MICYGLIDRKDNLAQNTIINSVFVLFTILIGLRKKKLVIIIIIIFIAVFLFRSLYSELLLGAT